MGKLSFFRSIFGSWDDGPTTTTVKSQKETTVVKKRPIVEVIQEQFDLEMDSMIRELNIRPELEKIESQLAERHCALKTLGFVNTPDVIEVERLEKENKERLKRIQKNDEILEGINLYRMKYPTLKVITLDTLTKVCQKYGLGYGAVRFYTGAIPQKNLDEMMRVKINNKDKAVLNEYDYNGGKLSDWSREKAEKELRFTSSQEYLKNNYSEKSLSVSPLVIAAPPNDFKEGVQVGTDGKMEFKPMKNEDPIVMQPVNYKEHIYMLVLTAWGPEASDPDIVNERFN